jgi:predicted small metal-binding protein
MAKKHIACADVVEGCAFQATADTEQELLRTVSAHATKDHGIEEVTPELAAQLKAAIKSR